MRIMACAAFTLLVAGVCRSTHVDDFDPNVSPEALLSFVHLESRFVGSYQGGSDGNSWSLQLRADCSFRLRVTRKDGLGDCIVPGTWFLTGSDLGVHALVLV